MVDFSSMLSNKKKDKFAKIKIPYIIILFKSRTSSLSWYQES